MKMELKDLAQRVAEGDPASIGMAEGLLKANRLIGAEIHSLWLATLTGILRNPSSGLIKMGVALSDTKQEPESREMYESLFLMCASTKRDKAYVGTIQTGAAVARLTSGKEPEGMDKDAYLKLAKQGFMKMIEENEGDARTYAAEALRHIKDYDVKMVLTNIARTSDISALKTAAQESMGHIRSTDELEQAMADKEFLLEVEYPDTTCPQVVYVDTLYSAIENALLMKKGKTEDQKLQISMMQLLSFTEKRPEIDYLFSSENDKDNLKRIERSVENALLNVLTNGSPQIKGRAAEGLVNIGSDRVENILDAITAREGEASDTGKVSSEALSRIRGNKTEIFFLPDITPPPPSAKVLKAVADGPRKPARQ